MGVQTLFHGVVKQKCNRAVALHNSIYVSQPYKYLQRFINFVDGEVLYSEEGTIHGDPLESYFMPLQLQPYH